MESLIDLATSHVTQHINGHVKSEWGVKLNNTDDVIQTFPKHFTDSEIFMIMDFAKKYELQAFNAGINFGKKKTVEVYNKKLDELYEAVEYMKKENERISSALENVYFQMEAQQEQK